MTRNINDPEDHGISDNLANKPSDEDPPESIAEGVQNEAQTIFTAVENHVSSPITENYLPFLEMELPSHPGAEWEEPNIPKGRSISHGIISGKKAIFISFGIKNER